MTSQLVMKIFRAFFFRPPALLEYKKKSHKPTNKKILALFIEESLSNQLAGLQYSLLAFLAFVCVYPFIRWLKIPAT